MACSTRQDGRCSARPPKWATQPRDYLLSASHPIGRFKAAFFQSLGYDTERWEELEASLRQLVMIADAETDEVTEYGRKYRVTGVVTGPLNRPASIVTVWIVRHGEGAPRFVTAFPGR